jgi:hypothetical protein
MNEFDEILSSLDDHFGTQTNSTGSVNVTKLDGYAGSSSKKKSIIDTVDTFEPKDIDPESIQEKRSRTFAIGYAGERGSKDQWDPSPETIKKYVEVAEILFKSGYVFRSQGWKYPKGNEPFKTALEKTIMELPNAKSEVYNLWNGSSNTENPRLDSPTMKAFQYTCHLDTQQGETVFNDRNKFTKVIMARNTHLMLGENLDSPLGVYIIATPDGSEANVRGANVGGLYLYLKMASKYSIPVININPRKGQNTKSLVPQLKELLSDAMVVGE